MQRGLWLARSGAIAHPAAAGGPSSHFGNTLLVHLGDLRISTSTPHLVRFGGLDAVVHLSLQESAVLLLLLIARPSILDLKSQQQPLDLCQLSPLQHRLPSSHARTFAALVKHECVSATLGFALEFSAFPWIVAQPSTITSTGLKSKPCQLTTLLIHVVVWGHKTKQNREQLKTLSIL